FVRQTLGYAAANVGAGTGNQGDFPAEFHNLPSLTTPPYKSNKQNMETRRPAVAPDVADCRGAHHTGQPVRCANVIDPRKSKSRTDGIQYRL
ncbi:MAG: hypothetical protein J4N78_15825, partial [Chloroflexi bacterium]|nr:hypothetical protein [Chloroflexota bacterium]